MMMMMIAKRDEEEGLYLFPFGKMKLHLFISPLYIL